MNKKTKKTSYKKPVAALLLLVLILCIAQISTISALELNPFATAKFHEKDLKVIDSDFLKKDFNSEYGTIRLSKTFFWIETDKIAEYSLIYNTKGCFKNCYLGGKGILYQDGVLFEDANFINIQGKETALEYSQYFIKVQEEIFWQDPITAINSTKIIDAWKEYNGEKLKAGNYEWELRGSKMYNIPIDAIPNAFGKSFDEWAWWDAVNYYEDTTSFNTAVPNAGSASIAPATGMRIRAVENVSLFGIIQTTSGAVHPNVCYVMNLSRFVLATGNFAAGNVSCNFTVPYNVTKGGEVYLFVNKTTGTYTQRYKATITLPIIDGNINWTASVNEVLIESTTDVQMITHAIYRTYFFNEADYGVMAKKNSPADKLNTTTTTQNFNCSFEAFNGVNILNFSIGIWNSSNYATYINTNTTPYNSTNMSYTWVQSLPSGNYNWNCWANNRNDTYNSTGGGLLNYTLIIDTIPPSINITYPLSQTYYNNYVYQNNKTIQINWTVSDLNGVGNCILYNGTANNTVTCYVNVSYQNITFGLKNFIFYANDTIGNINSSLSTPTFYYRMFHNNQTYNSVTLEGNNELFSLNFTKNSSIQISYINLIYNNTAYTGTYSITGDEVYAYKSFIIPSVLSEKNNTFYWNIITSEGIEVNTTLINQTVKNIALDNCSTYTNVLYNFTLKDEETKENIVSPTSTDIEISLNIYDNSRTVQVINFSQLYKNTNPARICLENQLLNNLNYSGVLNVKYSGNKTTNESVTTDYSTEYYNLLNDLITNSTSPRNINLYDLKTADTTTFQLIYRDNNYNPAANIMIYLYRQYISDNDYKIVEIPLTDSNGKAILNLVRNDIIYNFVMVNEDNEIVATFNKVTAFCQDYTIGSCSINLNEPSEADSIYNYDDDLGISYSLPTYNNITQIVSFEFMSINLSNVDISIEVIRDSPFGNRSVCTDSLISSTGTLSCNASSITSSDRYLFATIYLNGEQKFTKTIDIEESDSGFGVSNGSFIALLIILFLVCIFMEDKKVLLVSLIIGWVIVVSLELINGTIIGSFSAGIWLIITISIMLWKLTKEDRQG